MSSTINLDGPWQLHGVMPASVTAEQVLREPVKAPGWLPAAVPGEVHLDLMRNGILLDPYYGDNEPKSAWVHERDWWYRRKFAVDASLLKEKAVELVFDGIDTFATIYVNGKVAGTAENMHRQFRFDVKSLLQQGENEIAVALRAPIVELKKLEAKYGFQSGGHHGISQARKAQYSVGWDWGPDLASIGIWRSVRLEGYSKARIVSVYARALSLTPQEAEVEVQVELNVIGDVDAALAVGIKSRTTKAAEITGKSSARLVTGTQITTLRLKIPQPKLWWPNGYGEQHRYEVSVHLTGVDLDLRSAIPFGLRTIQLVQKPDEEGETFIFKINNVDIFCKGINWIPGDQFLPRVSEDYYRKNLELAAKASMNMVRVWGGGIFENPAFFEQCDKLGIMVWQDFMFACASYPEYDSFREDVEGEINQAIRDLRNYPSLTLWCGNNECHWAKPHKWTGFIYYDEMIPKLLAELDPARPFWNGSPWSGSYEKKDDFYGDHHSYAAWVNWGSLYAYLIARGKFISEFGFQAPATNFTLEKYVQPEDRKPWSLVMEIHEKQTEKFVRNNRYISAHFPISSKFDLWCYAGQCTQATGLKMGVTHWRRRKWLTAGVLIWQLNDCWPVVSWSLVDYLCRPKAGWYEARRSFAPVLLSVQIDLPPKTLEIWQLHHTEPWDKNDRSVHLVNDTLEPIKGLLRVRTMDFSGKTIWKRELAAEVAANSAINLVTILRTDIANFDQRRQLFIAELLDASGKTLVRDVHWMGEPKHMLLPENPLTFEVQGQNIKITASAAALFVEVSAGEGILSDNYFHMLPGETKTVAIEGPAQNVAVRSISDLLRDA